MHFSTEFYIIASDIITFFSGFLIGGLFLLFRLASRLPNFYISPFTKGTKANFVQITDDVTGKELIFANPETFKQSLELLTVIAKWNLDFTKKSIMFGDEKREHRLFCCYILMWMVAIGIALFNFFHIQT